MARFTKESRPIKVRQDPKLSTSMYKTPELQADTPDVTTRKLEESVSLVVAKVRRAIRKDRSTLEKELKLLKDAVGIYKSVRELDLRMLEIQLKSQKSQELAQIILNLNSLPDEQLKSLAKDILANGIANNNQTGQLPGSPIHYEQPTQELQEQPVRNDSE